MVEALVAEKVDTVVRLQMLQYSGKVTSAIAVRMITLAVLAGAWAVHPRTYARKLAPHVLRICAEIVTR